MHTFLTAQERLRLCISLDSSKYNITTCFNTLSINTLNAIAHAHIATKHIALTFERILTTKHTDLSKAHAHGVKLYIYYNTVQLFRLMEQNICTISIRLLLRNLPQSHVFNTLNTNTHANVVKERNFILYIAYTLENKAILAEQTSME